MSAPTDHIPLVDLKWQHQQVAAEVDPAIAAVIANTAFVLGPGVSSFENAYAQFERVDHCVGVANGTDAIELMLRAAGIGTGDEVIVPANTFAATALAVLRTGASVVFADVDADTLLVTVDTADAARTPKSRALIAVHLYGQFAPVEQLKAWAHENGIVLFEDAAQSHGASRHGEPVGKYSVAAATSFYPGKNLGAYGDGGAVLTNAPDIAQRVRALRNYGGEVKYIHDEIGFNSRLDTLQAVVLEAKLRRLAEWNALRQQAATLYDELLASDERILRPSVAAGNEHVFHLYAIRVDDRDRVLKELQAAGIGAGIHYPIPLHRQGAFSASAPERPLAVCERDGDRLLSLPLYPGITESQQERVASTLRSALA